LSETEPQQFTGFDQEKIFRFALSSNGKNIACKRFSIIFDTVLLSFNKQILMVIFVVPDITRKNWKASRLNIKESNCLIVGKPKS